MLGAALRLVGGSPKKSRTAKALKMLTYYSLALLGLAAAFYASYSFHKGIKFDPNKPFLGDLNLLLLVSYVFAAILLVAVLCAGLSYVSKKLGSSQQDDYLSNMNRNFMGFMTPRAGSSHVPSGVIMLAFATSLVVSSWLISLWINGEKFVPGEAANYGSNGLILSLLAVLALATLASIYFIFQKAYLDIRSEAEEQSTVNVQNIENSPMFLTIQNIGSNCFEDALTHRSNLCSDLVVKVRLTCRMQGDLHKNVETFLNSNLLGGDYYQELTQLRHKHDHNDSADKNQEYIKSRSEFSHKCGELITNQLATIVQDYREYDKWSLRTILKKKEIGDDNFFKKFCNDFKVEDDNSTRKELFYKAKEYLINNNTIVSNLKNGQDVGLFKVIEKNFKAFGDLSAYIQNNVNEHTRSDHYQQIANHLRSTIDWLLTDATLGALAAKFAEQHGFAATTSDGLSDNHSNSSGGSDDVESEDNQTQTTADGSVSLGSQNSLSDEEEEEFHDACGTTLSHSEWVEKARKILNDLKWVVNGVQGATIPMDEDVLSVGSEVISNITKLVQLFVELCQHRYKGMPPGIEQMINQCINCCQQLKQNVQVELGAAAVDPLIDLLLEEFSDLKTRGNTPSTIVALAGNTAQGGDGLVGVMHDLNNASNGVRDMADEIKDALPAIEGALNGVKQATNRFTEGGLWRCLSGAR